MRLKKRYAVFAALVGAIAALSAVAFAQSPHFVSASASVNPDGSLTVSFKEAGLGDNQLINYTASADAAATYVCVNNGGGHPSATNKTTVSGPVSKTGTFSSGKNGNITASLTLSPPPRPAPDVFSCPSGQTLQLALVSYTNVAITDTTNGIPAPIPGAVSSCLLPNVRKAC